MKVKILYCTPDADMAVYKAARTCYQKGSIFEIARPNAAQLKKFIYGLIDSGHTSTLEHCLFTFGIEGISRVVSHELVRHRIASYSQQSQRYCELSDDTLAFMPADMYANDEARAIYTQALKDAVSTYWKLIDLGIAKQDARYVLPNATPTQIVVSMNARSLLNFFALRCCRRAQPEMQELAYAMLAECKRVAPVLFGRAGRQCATCTEKHKPDECR